MSFLCRTGVRRGAAVLGAAVAALVLWAGSGGDPVVRTGGADQRVGVGAVLVTSLLAGLAGWGLLAVLERTTRRGFRLWLAAAVLVLLLSLVAAAGAAVGAASVGVLFGLHCVVFAALVAGFWRTAR